MTETLIIRPRQPYPGGDAASVTRLFPGKKRVVACGGATDGLIRLVSGKRYDTIVCAFPSPGACFPPVQALRSAAPESRLIIFRPRLEYFEAKRDAGGELGAWMEAGRKLQLNAYRVVDAVIAGSPGEVRLLRRELGDTPVCLPGRLRLGLPGIVRRTAPLVSIIILTFNQLEDTRRCVDSVLRNTPGRYELIFADNGSTDGTLDYLSALAAAIPNARVLRFGKNLGFGAANNRAAAEAEGEYLLLLNNDAMVTPGWLERLLSCARSDARTGIAGPMTGNAVGEQVISYSDTDDPAAVDRFAEAVALRNAGRRLETRRITAFCVLVKRAVIEAVGLFDERFGPGGYEDFDLCLRVRQAGYAVVIARDVFVYHAGGKGYAGNNMDYALLKRKNARIFADKWCGKALEFMEALPKDVCDRGRS